MIVHDQTPNMKKAIATSRRSLILKVLRFGCANNQSCETKLKAEMAAAGASTPPDLASATAAGASTDTPDLTSADTQAMARFMHMSKFLPYLQIVSFVQVSMTFGLKRDLHS